MHKFSTAAPKSSTLTALHDPQAGTPRLLNVLKSTFAGGDPWRVPLARQSEPQALACGSVFRRFRRFVTRTYA